MVYITSIAVVSCDFCDKEVTIKDTRSVDHAFNEVEKQGWKIYNRGSVLMQRIACPSCKNEH